MGFGKKTLTGLLTGIVIFFTLCPSFHASVGGIDVTSPSAIVMDQKTGRIFYEKNIHEKRRIASITKIMTAIIAIESGKLNETVRVSEQAVRTEGSSVYLMPGEKIKLEDLVYGLMLRSGNDAAVAIAEHVGGSVEGFVFLMNEKAQQIGMKNTHFANPHGLDDHEDHYSTAYDMAILTKYAMENETFRKISAAKVHYAPDPNGDWQRKWVNKNRLLTELYKYSTGGKTGYTKRAKRTLVSTASKDGMDLIAVTLNNPSQSDWTDHIRMFEYVFDHYDYYEVLPAGKIKKIDNNVYKDEAYLARNFVYPIKEEEKDLFEVHYRLKKPKKGWAENKERIPEIIGKADVYFDGQKIRSIPVYYKHRDEKDGTIKKYFKQIFNSFTGVRIYD